MWRQQTGVALITVMLIVVIATVAATSIASRQQHNIHRFSNILNLEQAYMALLGSEDAARRLLLIDESTTDGFGDIWNSNEFKGGDIKIGPFIVNNFQIQDLQGRLNVNNLVDNLVNPPRQAIDPRYQTAFRTLFDQVGLPAELVDATYDWIDTDNNRYNQGAENDFYSLLTPPYTTSRQEMRSVSELFLLRHTNLSGAEDTDSTHRDRRKLIWDITSHQDPFGNYPPLITALPRGTPININTVADPMIFRAVVPGLTQSDAEAIFNDTQSVPPFSFKTGKAGNPQFGSTDEFWNRPSVAALVGNISQEDRVSIDIKSEYFLFTAEATNDDLVVYLNTVFRRIGTGSTARVEIMHRSFGKRGEI